MEVLKPLSCLSHVGYSLLKASPQWKYIFVNSSNVSILCMFTSGAVRNKAESGVTNAVVEQMLWVLKLCFVFHTKWSL